MSTVLLWRFCTIYCQETIRNNHPFLQFGFIRVLGSIATGELWINWIVDELVIACRYAQNIIVTMASVQI